MMFKEKSSKKRIHVVDNKKEISTLDALHSKAIENFNTIDEDIRKTESNLHIINQQYESNLQEISISNDVSNINQICISNISLKNQIIQLKSTLEKLNDNDEIDYYEKTGAIMFDYYNMIEEQSSHSTKKSNINLKKNKILKDLFCGTEVEEEKVEQPSIDKTTLINEYLSLTNNQYTFHSDGVVVDDVCEICGEEIIPLLTDALIICNNCGNQEVLLIEQNRPLLKHKSKENQHFSYKRINHFREWCNQVQGKESTDIPDEVFEKILNELKKEKITDTKTLTYKTMRCILKKLKINKYYEHINYIIHRINGVPTPQFSTELEEKLCQMFKDIQGPFLKYCPKERKNFLSYSYVLYKFCEILGHYEYLKFFPLLKSRSKVANQDWIWKQICKDLGYPVISSL
jgi:predicted RNA-binding Zn-ribbon protein involved in translation (DUF1610 family)